jgi:hypothetical protein
MIFPIFQIFNFFRFLCVILLLYVFDQQNGVLSKSSKYKLGLPLFSEYLRFHGFHGIKWVAWICQLAADQAAEARRQRL